MHNIHLLKY